MTTMFSLITNSIIITGSCIVANYSYIGFKACLHRNHSVVHCYKISWLTYKMISEHPQWHWSSHLQDHLSIYIPNICTEVTYYNYYSNNTMYNINTTCIICMYVKTTTLKEHQTSIMIFNQNFNTYICMAATPQYVYIIFLHTTVCFQQQFKSAVASQLHSFFKINRLKQQDLYFSPTDNSDITSSMCKQFSMVPPHAGQFLLCNPLNR